MAVSLEHEVLTLREQVVHLLADNTHLNAQLQEVLTLVGQLRGTIAKQEDHIAKLVKMTFGRKSERIEGPTLFDDLPDEPVVPPPPVIPEPVESASPTRRDRPQRGREGVSNGTSVVFFGEPGADLDRGHPRHPE